MMSENNAKAYELLAEVTKLLKKYGKDTLLNLATILRDPHITSRLADALEDVTKLSTPREPTKKRPSLQQEKARFRQSLTTLGEKEPEKAGIVLSLFESLEAKTILPSLRALATFISDQGLSVPKAKSRDKAVLSFLRQCVALSLMDLQTLADNIASSQPITDGDRSLAGWGRIILDRKTEKS